MTGSTGSNLMPNTSRVCPALCITLTGQQALRAARYCAARRLTAIFQPSRVSSLPRWARKISEHEPASFFENCKSFSPVGVMKQPSHEIFMTAVQQNNF
jgi:hypothetical protein